MLAAGAEAVILICADICEPLCMEIAPGQRCKRPLRVKDCGRGNLT